MGAGWPRWMTFLAAGLALIGLAASYVGGMRLVLDASKPGGGYTPDERDALYLSIHGLTLLFAILLGYTLGQFSRRQGFAWAVLFATIALGMMAATLVGSRELACAGDINDVVRHWECSR